VVLLNYLEVRCTVELSLHFAVHASCALQGVLQDHKAYLLPAGFCIETNQVIEWYVPSFKTLRFLSLSYYVLHNSSCMVFFSSFQG
jgi:hypothetical protein